MPEPDTQPFLNCQFEVDVTDEEGSRVELGPSFVSRLQARRTRQSWFSRLFRRQQSLARVSIRRGVTHDKYLFDWHLAVISGKPGKRELRVLQFSRDHADLVNMWTLKGCFPVSWQGPEFDAMRPDVTYEEIVLVYSTIEWWSPS